MLDTMMNSRDYPLRPESSLLMRFPVTKEERFSGHIGGPFVKAATELGLNSSTEAIDINSLSQKTNHIYQSVEVAVVNGRLFCINAMINSACWLKMVPLAKDCQSSNVILMIADKGVVLKTIKIIHPGEPLLMWFTENILAMMNIPFLTPRHILGENRYTCQICNFAFECPNPLKIHLALRCNRLDLSYLWTKLAKEFHSCPKLPLTLNLFPPVLPFKFELSGSPRTSPTEIYPRRTTPTIAEVLNNSANINSPTSSSQGSPESESERHPSSMDVPQVRRNLGNCHSAFQPYSNRPVVYPCLPKREEPIMTHYHQIQAPAPSPIPSRVTPAQLETLCSNLGKLKQGHRCCYCGKIYSRKYGLKIHIRTHTGYKPLQCKYCLRPFGDPSNLNKHVRLHADADRNTPYRCDTCGKNLVRRRDLERHMRSRHQENVGHVSDYSSEDLDV